MRYIGPSDELFNFTAINYVAYLFDTPPTKINLFLAEYKPENMTFLMTKLNKFWIMTSFAVVQIWDGSGYDMKFRTAHISMQPRESLMALLCFSGVHGSKKVLFWSKLGKCLILKKKRTISFLEEHILTFLVMQTTLI